MLSLKELRRKLHQNPELSGQEKETQKLLKEQLKTCHPDSLIAVGETGLLICFEGKDEGPTILLRADIDALPIAEANDFAHRSQHEGVSHKCGHDGHTTIMVGVARHLGENCPQKGRVYLLFQPAEEVGVGAQKVLDDPQFQKINYDAAFALHNLPGFPLGQIVWRHGNFTPGVKSVAYLLKGREAHAAEPHKGINPAVAMAKILPLAETLSRPDITKSDFRQATVVHALLGEKAYGISPGNGEVHFTIRAWDNEELEKFQAKLDESVMQIAAQHNLECKREWGHEFWPNKSSEAAVKLLVKTAEEEGFDCREIESPFAWGEDFGLFIKDKPGALFGLGAGEDCPVLHHPSYDFPDELIEYGQRLFTALALNYTNGKH